MAYAYFRWGHPWKRITNHLLFPEAEDESVSNGLRQSSRIQEGSNQDDVLNEGENAAELQSLMRMEEENQEITAESVV